MRPTSHSLIRTQELLCINNVLEQWDHEHLDQHLQIGHVADLRLVHLAVTKVAIVCLLVTHLSYTGSHEAQNMTMEISKNVVQVNHCASSCVCVREKES